MWNKPNVIQPNMDSVQLSVAANRVKSQVNAGFPVTYPVNDRIGALIVEKTSCPLHPLRRA